MSKKFRKRSLAISFLFFAQFICVSRSFAALGSAEKKVRLLFPIERGSELDLLAGVISSPKLLSLDGKSYVLAAEFADAVVAFRLGKSIQSRLKLPFILAYDSGHPQSDFRWLQAEVKSSKLLTSTALQDKKSSRLLAPSSILKAQSSGLSPQGHIKDHLRGNNPKARTLSKAADCIPVSKCLSEMKIYNPLISVLPSTNPSKHLGDSVSIGHPLPANVAKVSLATTSLQNPDPRRSARAQLSSATTSERSITVTKKPVTEHHLPLISTSISYSSGQTPLLVSSGSLVQSFQSRTLQRGSKFSSPFSTEQSETKPIGQNSPINETDKPSYNSAFISDQNRIPLSQVSAFTFSDPGLVYVFVRLSDIGQTPSLLKIKNLQAIYRVKEDLYAQIAVYNSSRLGRQALDDGLNTLVSQGLRPMALTSRQFLSMAS